MTKSLDWEAHRSKGELILLWTKGSTHIITEVGFPPKWNRKNFIVEYFLIYCQKNNHTFYRYQGYIYSKTFPFISLILWENECLPPVTGLLSFYRNLWKKEVLRSSFDTEKYNFQSARCQTSPIHVAQNLRINSNK